MQYNGEIPLLERHRIALQLASYGEHNAPALIRAALGQHPFESLELELEDKHGNTLMFRITVSLWNFVQTIGRTSKILEPEMKRVDLISLAAGKVTPMNFLIFHWVPLIRELATVGADLHHIFRGRSVFLNACERRFWKSTWIRKSGRFNQDNLRRWLQLLADAGIGLTKFGKAEAILLQQCDQCDPERYVIAKAHMATVSNV
jgi:hypothetical protein